MVRVILLFMAVVGTIYVRATYTIIGGPFSGWWWIWIISTVAIAATWGWVSARYYEHKKRTRNGTN